MKLKIMTPINIGLNTRSLEEEKRGMETEFRSRILKLLKEDEEFKIYGGWADRVRGY